MAIIYKDIDLLTQKSSVAGTEKLPVSDTQYITPSQIAASVPVDASLSSSSTNAIQNKAVGMEFGKVVYLGDTDESVESIPDTIEGITMNGSRVAVAGGVADLGTVVTAETDPVFTASAAHGISSTDISNWNAKQKAITISSSEPTSSQGSNGDIWIVI